LARKLWEVSEKLTGVEWPVERSDISSRRGDGYSAPRATVEGK
jgi:hypothetical protein